MPRQMPTEESNLDLEWEKVKGKVPEMSQAWNDAVAFSKGTIGTLCACSLLISPNEILVEKAQPGQFQQAFMLHWVPTDEFNLGLEWEKVKEKVPDMSQTWNDIVAFSKDTIGTLCPLKPSGVA
jgi:hypothetical protein